MSLAIVTAGARRVVASVDDRFISRDRTIRNGKEVLFEAGERTLVGVVGVAILPCAQLDEAHFIPSRVWRLCGNEQLRGKPRLLIEAIRDDLYEPLSAAFRDHPDKFQWLLPDQKVVFVAFCVHRRQGGRVDLLELRFPMSGDVNGRPVLHESEIDVFCDAVPGSKGPAYSVGGRDSKMPGAPISPDNPDAQVLANMDRLFRLASDQDEAVGACAHVAAIEDGGIRWLRRPQVEAVEQVIEPQAETSTTPDVSHARNAGTGLRLLALEAVRRSTSLVNPAFPFF